MDFTKLFCRIHPQQPITNYCIKQQCQVELCASCICSHTNLHLGQGSSPNYQNIRDTYKKLLGAIKEQVGVLEDVAKRVTQIQGKVKEKKQKAREIMRQARQETLEAINLFFVNKQKQFLMQIEGSDKKYGLHCQARLEKLTKNSQKQIQNLITITRRINSHNFIQNLHKINTQQLYNARVVSQQMRAQVLDNESYNTTIVYNKGILKDVQQLLENVVLANISREQRKSESRVKMNLPVSYENSRVFEDPKLFTLRRPASQSSLPTITPQLSPKNSTKGEYPFKNVFQNNQISNKESRVTVANRKIDRLQQIEENQSFGSSSTSGFNKKPKESVLNQKPPNNYDFTFGNIVGDGFSKAKNIKSDPYQNEFMRASEKWQPSQNKNYRPEFVSNFQARQISSHINKMSKNQHQNRGNSDLDGLQKSSKLSDSRNSSRFMYRTQFL